MNTKKGIGKTTLSKYNNNKYKKSTTNALNHQRRRIQIDERGSTDNISSISSMLGRLDLVVI